MEGLTLFGEFYLDKTGEVHFMCHTKEDFLKTRETFEKIIALLADQIKRQSECPFYRTKFGKGKFMNSHLEEYAKTLTPEQREQFEQSTAGLHGDPFDESYAIGQAKPTADASQEDKDAWEENVKSHYQKLHDIAPVISFGANGNMEEGQRSSQPPPITFNDMREPQG